jgi:hypothetical protein
MILYEYQFGMQSHSMKQQKRIILFIRWSEQRKEERDFKFQKSGTKKMRMEVCYL